jgi:hypothetical protein
MASRSSSFQITLVSILCLIIILGVGLLLLTRQKCRAREGFADVPKDISHEVRDDVDIFLNKYVTLGDKVCPIQNYILDGIAKTTKGAQGGGEITSSDLVTAKVKANAMANGQLFDCLAYKNHKEVLNKEKITIKELYDIIDDLPDNVGYRLWHTAEFSSVQLKETYTNIKATLTAATTGTIPGVSGTTASAPITNTTLMPPSPADTTEGFADAGPAPSTPILSRCKTKDLCPEEMAAVIEKRIVALLTDISKAETGVDGSGNGIGVYLELSTKYMEKLATLKEQAEKGTLIGPQLQ